VKLYDSGVVGGFSAMKSASVDVTNKTTLRLVVTDGGDNLDCDHADWANARLTTTGASNPTPSLTSLSPASAAAGGGGFTLTVNGNNFVTGAMVAWNGSTRATTLVSGTQVTALITAADITTVGARQVTVVNPTPGGGTSNALAFNVTGTSPPGSVTFLSDLSWTSATSGWGPVELDRSNGEQAAGDGHPLTIRGATYAKGLGVHAASDLSYALNGAYTTFLADVGVDDETNGQGSVVFQVWVDGVKLYDSGLVTGTTAVKSVSVDVTGKTTLRLVVTDGGNNNASDHADWANARLTTP
jgi:hypothetical protein